jgi:PRC-barrel domain
MKKLRAAAPMVGPVSVPALFILALLTCGTVLAQQQQATPAVTPTEGDTSPVTAPAAEPGASSGTAAVKIVGRAVVTAGDAPLGKVSEVVFDSRGQPEFVVVSVEGKNSAVPYALATSMLDGDKLVLDKDRLQAAPKVKESEWRDQSSSEWKNDATRYWERG